MKFGTLFDKLPKAFLGLLLGITFGAVGGAIFGNMEVVNIIGTTWKSVFIFLGSLFGFIAGWKDGEE